MRRRLARGSRGAATVFTLLMIPVLLALTGLVVDTAFLAHQLLMLDGAVDAAARAATDGYDRTIWANEGRVVIDESNATLLAREYLQRNMPAATVSEVLIVPPTANTVRVTARATVYFAFMKIFGFSEVEVQAFSVAKKQ